MAKGALLPSLVIYVVMCLSSFESASPLSGPVACRAIVTDSQHRVGVKGRGCGRAGRFVDPFQPRGSALHVTPRSARVG